MKTETPNAPQKESMLQHIWASLASMVILLIICSAIYPLIVFAVGQLIFPNQANGSLLKKDGSYTTDASQAVGSALLGQSFSAAQYFHPRPSAAGSGYDATSSSGTNLGPTSDKLLNGATNAATTQPTTQPESIAYPGVRLFSLRYAIDNGLSFKLYTQRADQTGTKTEVPLKNYQDAQGNLLEVQLIDAFPHPYSDSPDRMVLTAADFCDSSAKPVQIPADAVTASASGLDPHISPANADFQIARVAAARHIDADKVRELVKQYTDGPNLGFLGDPGVNVLRLNIALDNKYPVPGGK
jgi:K+-transporting ATPase ATPase C chain